MTVLVEDRIEMAATRHELSASEAFEWLERITPEGYRVDIIEGAVFMSPQRNTHWQIIRRIIQALDRHFGCDVEIGSDQLVQFPGEQNFFCPDVMKLRDGAKLGPDGLWHHEDIEFVAEVISKRTGMNDYGPKKSAYAVAGIPVYLVADPYQRRCHVYTDPRNGNYRQETSVDFGADVDLTKTPLGLTLKTDAFPTD